MGGWGPLPPPQTLRILWQVTDAALTQRWVCVLCQLLTPFSEETKKFPLTQLQVYNSEINSQRGSDFRERVSVNYSCLDKFPVL